MADFDVSEAVHNIPDASVKRQLQCDGSIDSDAGKSSCFFRWDCPIP